jgi:hypothetical protein
VKRQVENALIVVAKRIGRMEFGRLILAQFNAFSVGIAVSDSVKSLI